MSKKSMIITGIVALVVVGLAALLFLMPRSSGHSPLQSTTSTSAGSGTTTGTGSNATSSTTNTTNTTATPGGTTQGQTGSTSSDAGKAPSDAATNGKGVSTDILKVYPKLPAAQSTAAPGAPIAAGQPLPRLSPGPDNTISAVKTGVVQQGAQYKVVIRPLGFGPDLPFGSRIVVHVDSAQRVGIAPKKSPIANADVLVLADTTHGGTITKGGTYTATITFLTDGTKLLPVMTLVASK